MRQTLYYNKRGVYSNRVCISLADTYPLVNIAGRPAVPDLRLLSHKEYIFIRAPWLRKQWAMRSNIQRILSPTGYESGGLQSFTLYANMCTLLVMFCLTGLK